MGREVKKIEKASARHVSFTKRRNGLMKKAKALSILCDADVGLIVFSAHGNLFHYSNSSMETTLKKYSENTGVLNIELDDHYFNFKRIKQEMEDINHTLRHMDGEDLQGLTIKDLQKLEQNLEVGLQRIRSTKGNGIEEENARLHREVEQLKQRSNLQNNTSVEFLLIEPLDTRDQSESRERIYNSCTPISQHNRKIHQNEASEASLQLGLSI